METRLLTASDVEGLGKLVQEWVDSCGAVAIGLPLPTVARVTMTLEYLVTFKDCCVIGLFDGDTICGFMGGQSQENHFCETRMLTECFWFVSRQYRRYGKRLVTEMKEWGKLKGCTHMKISSSMAASADAERVARMLGLWGFAPYEFAFIGGL